MFVSQTRLNSMQFIKLLLFLVCKSSTMALCFKLSSDVLLHGKFLIINSYNTKKYKIPYLTTGMSSCLSFVNLSMEVMAESKVWYV